MTKLTQEQVDYIRAEYRPYSATRSFASFARKFNCTPSTIYQAYTGMTHKGVESDRRRKDTSSV
jgi:DNA-binding transcriptional regulator YhcF (GntR family)